MATRSKPVGLTLVGVVLIGSALILVLISIALAAGDLLVIENTPLSWVLIGGVAIALMAAYFAIRIGFGLFANPAKNREATESALWLGLPVVLIAMVGTNLFLTGGSDDVTVWPLVAVVGVLWCAVLIAAALYMRSRQMRAYFAEVA